HLQNSKVHAQLQFFAAVETGNLTYLDGAALVRPIVRDGVEVQAHRSKHPVFSVRLSITSRLGGDAQMVGTPRSQCSPESIWDCSAAIFRWSQVPPNLGLP